MSKATPGPWKVNFTKFSEVRAENGALVAKCNKLDGLVNLQANARLIASAPDLLALCRCALRELAEQGIDDRLQSDLREAIAKATGAQS